MMEVLIEDSLEKSAPILDSSLVVVKVVIRLVVLEVEEDFDWDSFGDFFEDCPWGSPGDSSFPAGEEAKNVDWRRSLSHCRSCTKNLLMIVACLVMVEYR